MSQNSDPIDDYRRAMTASLNTNARSRSELELAYGQVWSTEELRADFEVLGFGAPFCVVKRKSDGKKGSLMFQAHPRLYFQFEEGP